VKPELRLSCKSGGTQFSHFQSASVLFWKTLTSVLLHLASVAQPSLAVNSTFNVLINMLLNVMYLYSKKLSLYNYSEKEGKSKGSISCMGKITASDVLKRLINGNKKFLFIDDR